MGENAKKVGGRVEEKKEENKGDEVMVTKEDDRSSIGIERSSGRSDFLNACLDIDRKNERTKETKKLNKINKKHIEKN